MATSEGNSNATDCAPCKPGTYCLPESSKNGQWGLTFNHADDFEKVSDRRGHSVCVCACVCVRVGGGVGGWVCACMHACEI